MTALPEYTPARRQETNEDYAAYCEAFDANPYLVEFFRKMTKEEYFTLAKKQALQRLLIYRPDCVFDGETGEIVHEYSPEQFDENYQRIIDITCA